MPPVEFDNHMNHLGQARGEGELEYAQVEKV
jgi:hypothetical protein